MSATQDRAGIPILFASNWMEANDVSHRMLPKRAHSPKMVLSLANCVCPYGLASDSLHNFLSEDKPPIIFPFSQTDGISMLACTRCRTLMLCVKKVCPAVCGKGCRAHNGPCILRPSSTNVPISTSDIDHLISPSHFPCRSHRHVMKDHSIVSMQPICSGEQPGVKQEIFSIDLQP